MPLTIQCFAPVPVPHTGEADVDPMQLVLEAQGAQCQHSVSTVSTQCQLGKCQANSQTA